ncbi:MAG: type II/IV secretion system protein [Clostridium sp.]|nr:type II/IV secretion system protein [Clostridium sp.]
MRASDIHFEPIRNIVHVRFRINGSLILVKKLILDDYLKVLSRLKVKGNMDITERRKAQDGKIIMMLDEKKFNCRLSTIPVLSGEKLVLRIIYEEKYQKLSILNFSDKQKDKIKKIMNAKNGLIIVNGPTGSGKTTTLYSMLGEINNDDINITTLEDPVEITMDGVNQINLNPKAGITFSQGLRAILRQDPDVIMIGEIRDDETANIAVRASITGHKVYSTIHTKSPREVYFRLEDMGVKGYLIRSSLIGIISQRLISVLCENCKEFIGEQVVNSKNIKLYKKCGCDKCNGTGVIGRTLISSVFYIDKSLREKIKNIHNEEDLLSNEEMFNVLKKLLEDGKIDYYDYLKFVQGEELDEN